MVVLSEIPQQSSYNYDVFLSFRGADTRNNFTDHLHEALLAASIRTFFDDTEIQTGECLKPELESAIESSRASIIVLSENYASSTWCLDELVLILEQQRNFNQIVIPIFYHVEPTHVRKQENSFGEAMAKHKKIQEEETDLEKKSQRAKKIKQWQKALVEVANLKGKEANGRETMLIKGIVEDVSSRLDLHKRTELPHIFGMESSIRKITAFLKDRSQQSTGILTIWGMAGIGKTYLANYVFKLHYLDFERSCFLEDIERRCTLPNGLLDLQKQLLRDIRTRSWKDISNTDEGTLKVEETLFRKRSLLVLDGVCTIEQLDVLIGKKGFYPGSKIIITSKSGLLTEKCRLFETEVPPKHLKHQLQGLEYEESLQLLSWHAFGSNDPDVEGDKKKATKVVEYCQGHPLALKVLGSSLRNENNTWDDILESLGNEINPDIEKVLKISFDALPSEKDKELFKYIACLFVGEDRKSTEDVLKACGVCKSSGIQILLNRCLLTLGSSDNLRMHQLLQDMGRDIVRQESPEKPWNCSILWHQKECFDVLQNRQGTTLIQGFTLDMRTFENEKWEESSCANMQKFGSYPSFNWVHMLLLSVFWWLLGWVQETRYSSCKTKGGFGTLALSEMRNLKILQLNYVQLSGSYKNFPQGLRWLCMHGFPLSYIPSDLQMENMVALDMSNSKLQQLWKKPKPLRALKFLNLSSCHDLVRVDHFSSLPVLERLTLARCTSLVEVCESIGTSCKKLEVLDLSECSKLQQLPRSIVKLKNLTQLLIDGCSDLGEFPVDNINMKSHGSSSSTMVPRSSKFVMSSLPRSLVKLSLTNCNLYNESFPVDFSSLSMLEELCLDENPIDSMPDSLRNLSRLRKLTCNRCYNLKTILCAPTRLVILGVDYCHSLEKITWHPDQMAGTPIVNITNSLALNEIQYYFKMQALSEVDEKVLRNLGWINIEYLKSCRFSLVDHFDKLLPERILPAQMHYHFGIFSTYLPGQEVPKWFTYRSSGPSFTLQSTPKKGKIQGLNVCIVYTFASMLDVSRSRIEIRNLTKNSSWRYAPRYCLIPKDDAFGYGDEVVVVWLSHWLFGESEFEDGDEVSIHFSSYYRCTSKHYILMNVREYGISPVYDDDGGNQKEDPLCCYKSWKLKHSGWLLDMIKRFGELDGNSLFGSLKAEEFPTTNMLPCS